MKVADQGWDVGSRPVRDSAGGPSSLTLGVHFPHTIECQTLCATLRIGSASVIGALQ
jgi:hypothetical protein